MKTYNYLFLVIVGIVSWLASPFAYAEMSVSTGMRYDAFTDDQTPQGDGAEWTIPFGVAYKRERLLVRFNTAYSRASVSPSAKADADIASFTDSLLAASYMFPDLPVGVIVGLDANLPTGQAGHSETDRSAEAGERHDLFEVDNFGEGLNVGLHLSLVKELGPVNVGLTGIYIFKGKYDPTTDTADDDRKPGNQLIGLTMLKWRAASWLKVESLLAYAHFAPDQTDGQESSQEGAKVVLSGAARLNFQPVEVVIGVQNVWQGKNQELTSGSLATEPANSNGKEFFGWFDLIYRASAVLDLELLGDLRYYSASERILETNGLPFEGQRVRYAAGPGLTYSFNDQLSCSASAKFFTMDQKRDVARANDATLRGMNLSVGVTYTF